MSRWAGTKLKRVEGHIRKRHNLKGKIKKKLIVIMRIQLLNVQKDLKY